MKFSIEKISKNSGRLGQLIQSNTGKVFKTPLLMQTTKAGSIPYLSKEVFEYVTKETQVLQMSLATMDQMAESVTIFGKGLGAYVGYKDSPTVMLIRDPCETMPQGSNDMLTVPLFTRRGKEQIGAQKYMELMESFQPDIYQGFNDADTNLESAKKRMIKSVNRTQLLMDYCYEKQHESEKLKNSALFAPIVGGYNTYNRSQSISHAKEKGAGLYSGYILEGFHNYGRTANEVNEEKFLEIMKHCLKELEDNMPKLVPGAFTPPIVLELIKLGIDMFDSSFAYLAAANFKVLTFNFDLNNSNKNEVQEPFLDITKDDLKEDFTPFLKDCSCLACSKHTKAYTHHLYKTRELLGPILIMIHNLHHYMQLFETIHKCIADDTLDDLIKLIKYQNGDKEIDYRIPENLEPISKAGLGKGFMENKKESISL